MVSDWRGQTVADLSRAFLDYERRSQARKHSRGSGKRSGGVRLRAAQLRDMAGSLRARPAAVLPSASTPPSAASLAAHALWRQDAAQSLAGDGGVAAGAAGQQDGPGQRYGLGCDPRRTPGADPYDAAQRGLHLGRKAGGRRLPEGPTPHPYRVLFEKAPHDPRRWGKPSPPCWGSGRTSWTSARRPSAARTP